MSVQWHHGVIIGGVLRWGIDPISLEVALSRGWTEINSLAFWLLLTFLCAILYASPRHDFRVRSPDPLATEKLHWLAIDVANFLVNRGAELVGITGWVRHGGTVNVVVGGSLRTLCHRLGFEVALLSQFVEVDTHASSKGTASIDTGDRVFSCLNLDVLAIGLYVAEKLVSWAGRGDSLLIISFALEAQPSVTYRVAMNNRARVGIIKERPSLFARASIGSTGTTAHASLCRSTDVFKSLSSSAASTILSGYAEGPGGTTGTATYLAGLRVGVPRTEARLGLDWRWLLNANPLSIGTVFHGHVVRPILWIIVADAIRPNLIRVRGGISKRVRNLPSRTSSSGSRSRSRT